MALQPEAALALPPEALAALAFHFVAFVVNITGCFRRILCVGLCVCVQNITKL